MINSILIRLPNWLGDMVMAYPFMDSLRQTYPKARIDIICKKGLEELVPFFGKFDNIFPFDKKKHSGINGVYAFGKGLKKNGYDLFICLPNSFSSALMGYATGAKHRVGYAKEMRQFFLTKTPIRPPEATHRSEVYRHLLADFNPNIIKRDLPFLHINNPSDLFSMPDGKILVFNVNSNADSRRLPVFKALEFLRHWLTNTDYQIVLPGHHTERQYVENIAQLANAPNRIFNAAGKTSIPQLMSLLYQADLMVTTDTGIAHLGNAMGTKTIMLLGAADERVTAPIFSKNLKMPRVPGLDCAPCVRNTCKVGGVPCLAKMEVLNIH